MSVQKQIERLTVHRAAEWLEVLRTGRSEEYPGFIQWINESPRHMDELLKLLALSREASEVMRDPAFDTSALLGRLSPRIAEFPASTLESPGRPMSRQQHTRWIASIAAGLAAVTLTALWMTGALSQWQRFETRIGEQGSFDLADGSTVILNARSQIRIRLGATAREIRLVDGEALFRVAHDAQRPFRVYTREAVVQAIGTQFDVAARLDGTRVAVVEGKVQVSTKHLSSVSSRATAGGASMSTATLSPLPLAAGEAAHISNHGAIERKSAEEAANATAWRQRRLIFERTPLEQAVNEFNRYHQSVQLRVEGIAAGSHHYSGTFDADDLKSFTDLLSRERDLSIERRGDEIVVRRRAHD